jgi:twinkle protein
MQILQPDDIDFTEYEQETDAQTKVRPASEYLGEILHDLSPVIEGPKYPKIPFANFWVECAPGEVTIWAGFNGSGKSMLQGQVLAKFAAEGQRVCIASFEMKPRKTLGRICRQMSGFAVPNKAQVELILKQLQTMWLYDQQGTVHPDRVIAVIRYCAEKLKVQHMAIDSLMKCVRGTENYDGQKDFIDRLTTVARDLGIHIHVVAHLKKGDSDERRPNRYDISGTADVSNLVDNVLLVWRNKKKERERDKNGSCDETAPDALIICDKQRNTCDGWEGQAKLWFDRNSMQFSDFQRAPRGLARDLHAA